MVCLFEKLEDELYQLNGLTTNNLVTQYTIIPFSLTLQKLHSIGRPFKEHSGRFHLYFHYYEPTFRRRDHAYSIG